ncbi:hypothetical protein [Lacisediminimonas profundi]|uniref:hypothetical protein n=1 Tax=Lacisediminimonas profundi TaxID=2603856 RepID=UPI00124B6C8D|nr:hypothetical protein [Lacisediminimonas profundi]
MKPIDLTLLAVTAGVGFMLFSLSRRANATGVQRTGYEQYLAQPNSGSYWSTYVNPSYLDTQATKEISWAINNAPASENLSNPSQMWTVG